MIHFAIDLKLTYHKSTILQIFKKIKKNIKICKVEKKAKRIGGIYLSVAWR